MSTAIKYSIEENNGTVEFASLLDAQAYKASKGLSSDIVTIEYDVVDEILEIPDVTPRQLKQALILSGITLADIDAALDTLSEPTKSLAKVEWEYSISFQRNRPLVNSVGTMLGWTSEQLDQLWIFAGTL